MPNKRKISCLAFIITILCVGSALSEIQSSALSQRLKMTSKELSSSSHVYQKYIADGLYYLELGSYEKAKEMFWRAIEIDSSIPDAYINTGIVEIELTNYESAQRILTKATTLISKDYLKKDILYYNLGLSFQMSKQYNKAIDYYTKALKIDPAFAETIFNLGVCHLQSGNKDKALIFLSKARSEFEDTRQPLMIQKVDKMLLRIMKSNQQDAPGFAASLLENSVKYFEKNDLDSAIALARESIIIFPQFVDAYYRLGLMYVAQGDIPQAITCFQSALGLKPTFAPAYIELAKIFETQTKYNLALTNYFRALKLDENNAFILYKIGLIHKITGRNLKAREWFRKAKVIALKKNDTVLLAEIDRVYKLK